ncbi:hypothetical protein TFLX_06424 [Thermoflexales bacterium]|nr:hypothetical protein TFLX_06424 [Thermoflexales bacterium]
MCFAASAAWVRVTIMTTIHLGRWQLRFDWQILCLLLSAVIGLAVAYQRSAATLQFSLFVAAVALYVFLLNKSEPILPQRSLLRLTLVLIPAMLGVYFLLTNDWVRWSEKLPFLTAITSWLANFPLGPTWLRINPNVVGGVMAVLLPLQVAALRPVRRWLQVVLISFSVAVLILTQTRGAWLALSLAIGMGAMWQIATHFTSTPRAARGIWISGVVLGGLALLALLTVTPLGGWLIDSSGQRPDIWRNSLALITDYPLTGHGFASFEMVYSTYALLVHVGHTLHAHNLWFDIWLNLGLLGVVSLAGLIINAMWPRPATSMWRRPALIALATLLLHGLYDDAWFGYGGAALPLLLLPLALATRAEPGPVPLTTTRSRRFQPAWVVWSVALIALVISWMTPRGQAWLETNRGALAQTQAELSVYHWPEIPIQDALRHSGQVDLTPAKAHYQAALQLDPDNAAAQRRLGQIELAEGQYDSACRHLARAGAVAPHQRATRQLLGECYAMQGEVAHALELWQSVSNQERQLETRVWWYDSYLGDSQRAGALSQVLQALDNHD